MSRVTSIFFAFFLILLAFPAKTFAIVDPSDVPNNKIGIHIINEGDLSNATSLVNSGGGDWGYVTIVITEAERDHARWQRIFDQMRQYHLIPIVRLATRAGGDVWDAPQEAEINNWAAFLNGLNWVTKNRYVVINNEPNHAKEWGGRLDPEGYADYLKKISKKLKETNEDFFILPAGLDPAAANKNPTMSSSRFIREMMLSVPDVFDYIDGWTSHPYPNASLSSYKSELTQIGKKLPVFVTETGWRNSEFSENEISQKILDAYKNIWNDPTVIAVTPFLLNYTNAPFDVFSWKKPDGSFYAYYSDVQKMAKIKGEPVQIEKGQILGAFAQPAMVSGMDVVGVILARNTGQTIWNSENIGLGSESGDFELKKFSLNPIEPTKLGLLFFKAAITQNEGIYTNSIYLKNLKDDRITNSFSIEGAFIKVTKEQIMRFISNSAAGLFRLW